MLLLIYYKNKLFMINLELFNNTKSIIILVFILMSVKYKISDISNNLISKLKNNIKFIFYKSIPLYNE